MKKGSDYSESLAALAKDARFRKLILHHGPPTIGDYFPKVGGIFGALARSIIYQQISGKAARSIHMRFVALFPHKSVTPARVLQISDAALRSVGLSRSKILYIKDAARKFADGTIQPRRFPRMSSEEIIEHLVQIRGIGVWSAHMLLIFKLGRLDILPTGDLAIRKAFQKMFGLKTMPTHKQMEKLARNWREHASVASWYLWRSLK